MTQHLQINLEPKQIQELIENSVKDDASKLILTTVFNQLMEHQRTEFIQANTFERFEKRNGQRNGYYERALTTRVGTLELKVPRTRDGDFSPTVFERYHRNEKALLASMLEMYASGVYVRKVSQIVEELCGKSVSKSFVSSLTSQLDPIVTEWQNRKLTERTFPYLMVDVLYIKARVDHRVISKSCHIAVGMTEEGERQIIGFMLQNEESHETWSRFFDYLKNRGLTGTKLVISDAHKGLVSAIQSSFTHASWQRCQVHFMRNILSTVPKKGAKPFREAVKTLFKFSDIDLTRKAKHALIEEYVDQTKVQKAWRTLDDGFEDVFQYTVVGKSHNQLKSTNLLERLNGEVRRREKVIRIFPNTASANRLIGAVLMDIHENWISSPRKYIQFESN